MNIRVGLIGFGNVGQGFVSLLRDKASRIAEERGCHISLHFIAGRSKGSFYSPEGIAPEKVLEVFASRGTLDALPGERIEDPRDLLRRKAVDVLAETTPTNLETGEPGLSYIRTALEEGISVTTTNKGPIALAWEELAALGARRGARLLCEGTVLSGTPAINFVEKTLGGCSVEEITGILNGTTNYMLTRMEEGMAYQEALKEAQDLGYAEADPTADVDGWDAAVKVVILGKILFGSSRKVEDIPRRGIREISKEQVEKALKEGKRIRLLGTVKRTPSGTVEGEVAPRLLEKDHPLAGVRGATNALVISTDVLGDVSVMGPGAGRRETGQALLVDILSLADRMK
ncbi:MAG TPA: homoserine dehydrogenase [Synergistaceae bacterium]|nr:homoserine dehydrogenase [Synergistaceae bacterium]HPJ25201.1 homoserine dehydrogenase [Synergistaceae bacterium]HPQ36390.1 homoserine dehydrogenase [Synergistaceae bacterium]